MKQGKQETPKYQKNRVKNSEVNQMGKQGMFI